MRGRFCTAPSTMIPFNKPVSRTPSMNKKLNDSAPCPCGQSDQHQSHALPPGARRAVTDERVGNGIKHKALAPRERKRREGGTVIPKDVRISCACSNSQQEKKVETQFIQIHPEDE